MTYRVLNDVDRTLFFRSAGECNAHRIAGDVGAGR